MKPGYYYHVGLPSGTSLDMESLTWLDNGVAFVKKLRYLRANVSVTPSCMSMMTASSSLSISFVATSLMLPGNQKFVFKQILKLVNELTIEFLFVC